VGLLLIRLLHWASVSCIGLLLKFKDSFNTLVILCISNTMQYKSTHLEANIKRIVESNFSYEIRGGGPECYWKQNVSSCWRIRRIQLLRKMAVVRIICASRVICPLSFSVEIVSQMNACTIITRNILYFLAYFYGSISSTVTGVVIRWLRAGLGVQFSSVQFMCCGQTLALLKQPV